MERSALFVFGNNGAEFVEFIARSVPLDWPVVMPDGYVEFSNQNLLQFFLFPRAIVGCPCPSFLDADRVGEDCGACLLDPERSVPAIGAFPPAELLEGKKTFIPFPNSDWYHGVYVPLDSPDGPAMSFLHMDTPLAVALLIDVGLLALLIIVGASVTYSILGVAEFTDLAYLALPIGAGCVTLLLFILSWMGATLTLSTYLAVMMSLLVGSVVYRLANHRRLFPASRPISSINPIGSLAHRPWLGALIVWAIVLVTAAIVISIARGYSEYDGIANWALKGYAIAETGSVTAGSRWGGHVLSYPQNIHLLIALFRLADGDVLPGSKFLFPLFGLSMIIGCYAYWRRLGVRDELAVLGAGLILSTPVIFLHSTIGWGNLVFSTYIVLGVLFTAFSLGSRALGPFWIAGLLVGMAVWTRPEGIGFAIALFLWLLGTLIVLRARVRSALAWFIPTVVVASTWGTFSIRWIVGDEIGVVVTALVSSLASGNLRLEVISELLGYATRLFTSTGTWGFLFVASGVLLVLAAYRQKTKIPIQVSFVLGAAVICLGLPLFMFYAASFDRDDLATFLSVSFDRALFPGAILLLAGALAGSLSYLTGRKEIPARGGDMHLPEAQ